MATYHAWTADREWLGAGDDVDTLVAVIEMEAAEEDTDTYVFVTIETRDGEVVRRVTIG